MKRLITLLALTFIVMTVSAIPAKPGLKRTLTLSDGSQVVATLVGDEFGHWFVDADGNTYTKLSDGIYQKGAVTSIKEKAAARRSLANAKRRAMLSARKKVGEVGNYTGQKKCLIILVNFSDDRKFKTSKDYFERIVNEENFSEGNFKGSMYDYFKAQSEGQFELTFDVVGPVEVSQTHYYYGGNDSDNNDKYPATMVIEALKKADSQVNYADYDWDGDGTVDQVYVVYAGVGEADSDDDDSIWPHAWSLSDAQYYGDGDGKQKLDNVYIDNYACGGELNGYTEETAGIGTMCHEFSHCLGYPDFYDIDYSGGQGMGYWDLMDGGSYNDDGYQPAGYTGYERWMAGWKTPITLTATTTVENMPALTTTGSNFYVIYNDANENEYFILENRQKAGWDSSLPGAGMLIVHVDYDATVWANNKPNDTPSHQRCTWIAADNEYQYTTKDGTKYYTFDGMVNDTYPYGLVNSFGPTTTPAAKLFNANSSGSYYLNSSVEDITQNGDGTISFRFKGPSTVATPTFSPAGGTFTEPQEVTISCTTEGSVIYYTTDGSTPTTSSTEYTTPIIVEETTTIKAVAITEDDESAIATAKYVLRDGSQLLYESLSGYDSENDASTELSVSNTGLDYDGWTTFTKVFAGGTSNAYDNGGCLKLGSSKNTGSLKASGIPLSGSGAISFYLKKYGSDSGKVSLTVSGATADVTSFTPASEWTECTALLTGCTGNVTITLSTTTKRAYLDEIVVYSTGSTPTKQDITLEWSTESATAILGEDFTAPTLTVSPDGLDITYTSSDTNVATIDNLGNITILDEGTTTISAIFKGTTAYNAATASYQLTVEVNGSPTPVTESGNYVLVTDDTSLNVGDKIIIVNEGDLQALSTTQKANNRAGTSFTFNSDNSITPNSDVAIITLGGLENAWTLYVTNGDAVGYLAATSNTKNNLHTLSEATENATATISISEGDASIVFNGDYDRNILRYNPNKSNGTPLFSCYSTGQNAVQIYREVVEKSIMLGDVNKDGSLNISDVAALVQIISGKDSTPSPYDYDAADVDENGIINISDVSALIGLLLGK